MAKKAIMFRYGGIGDTISLTAIAYILKKRGFERIEYCVPEKQVELFKGLDFIDKIIPTRRLPNLRGYDVIPAKGLRGWVTTETVKRELHNKNWLILEYKFLVEDNSMWRGYPPNEHFGPWARSMNSNYVNWVDLALAWANIDPQKIPGAWKRPKYKIFKEEIEQFSKKIPKNTIAVNLESSSLARTFYFKKDIVDQVLKHGYNAAVWDSGEGGWRIYFSNKEMTSFIPSKSVRESAAVIYGCDGFISADSGLSHIAEALGVKTTVLYTTVPSWTRSMYYQNTIPVDTTVECSPCFIIGKYCPKIEYEVNVKFKGLTKKEKEFLKEFSSIPLHEMAHKHRVTVDGLKMTHQAILQKMEALKNVEPDCMKSFDAEHVVARLISYIKTIEVEYEAK